MVMNVIQIQPWWFMCFESSYQMVIYGDLNPVIDDHWYSFKVIWIH